MKTQFLNVVSVILMALSFVACSEKEEPLNVNPLIGQWEAQNDDFIQIQVDGVAKTFLEFGMEVLGVNEAEAEAYAKSYVQTQILGPIALENPRLVFQENSFRSVFPEVEKSGQWEWLNDGQLLKFMLPESAVESYNFNVQRVDALTLELDWSGDVQYMESNAQVFEVVVKIKLVR
jgi:hypothetical protein